MNNPKTCEHDFRIVFPRHVTGEAQTSSWEDVLCVVCCGCGKSPIYFGVAEAARFRIRVGGREWPTELKITDYYWDSELGPSVAFAREDEWKSKSQSSG